MIVALPMAYTSRRLVEGGEVIEPLRDRILGRVTIDDMVDPETQETVIFSGTMLDEDLVDLIDKLGIDEVKVRTPLTCDTRYGMCAKCYGRDLGRGTMVNAGRGGWCDRCSIDRRAWYSVDHAYLPHRWCRITKCRCRQDRRQNLRVPFVSRHQCAM